MQLSEQHIDIISNRLKTGGISDDLLHNDLLDHICSYIEEQDTNDFESALQDALLLLAPGGMQEIEEEKYFLFHFQKQITMKRVSFFTGFVTTFAFTTGITFKLMSWPGASIILLLGYIGLLVFMLMMASTAMRHIQSYSMPVRIRIFTGIVAALLISMGSIFKLQHWPSANIQFVIGAVLLNFIFLPMFFYQLYKKSASAI